MSSVLPFQDLNLQPDLGSSSSVNQVIYPKIVPKLEPLDEPPCPPAPAVSIPTPEPTSTPQVQLRATEAEAAVLSDSGTVATRNRSPEELYNDFYKLTEMFRSAFAERMEQCDDDLDPDSRAIVPVDNVESQMSNVVISPRVTKKYPQRSSEMVRVTDLKPEDIRYFRDLIRRSRMVFDSIRVFSNVEDERNHDLLNHRRTRGDCRAGTLMRECGLWLNRDKRIVGAVPGVAVGDVFFFRMELCVLGLHGVTQAGIDYVPASQSSNGEPIATSIIVSGGYEDDEDAGDVIIYTGHGGQDKHKQVMHQKLECGNLALERSMHYGIEVRVIRGFKYEGSPSGKVYVYDGLYRIINTWFDVGRSGFGVYKFKLVRNENQEEMGSALMKFAESLRTRSLDSWPKGYITLDLSRKKENVPVFLFNDIDADHDPVYYDYLIKTVFPTYVYNYGGTGTGCDCVSGCVDNCLCAMKNGGEFPYDLSGILIRGKPLIFECGPHCRCPPTCRNRVSQKGVRNRFEVFRSRETGWGVRSLDLIQAGSFICEYTGVVLTRDQAQIFTMNGDSLVYPSRFAERWAEWGDLSQVFSDYVRPAYPAVPPLDFAMDVSRMRNLACYMSHSSLPNVFVQLVLYDHNNLSFPHLMLFALENIPPLRELSIDYGLADEWTGKPALTICE